MEKRYTIKLGGKEYSLVPKFRPLMEVEQETGKSLTKITTQWGDGDVSIKDITAVVHAGIVGGGVSDLSLDDVGNLIIQTGLNNEIVTAALKVAHSMYRTEESGGQKKKKSEIKNR